jgi:adenosylcobinamide-phosphate synthase
MTSLSFLFDQIFILFLAIAIDFVVGEPKEGTKLEKLHPTVWIGKITFFLESKIERKNIKAEYIAGCFLCILLIFIFAIPAWCIYLVRPYSEILYVMISAILFKYTFTITGIRKYVLQTVTSDLDKKRKMTAKIVSRNTKKLDLKKLNSAIVESTAENLTDSYIAPIFYFVLFGVAGAVAYRVVNTMDAMIGYQTRRYRYIGFFAAKSDYILNYVPERISMFLILFSKYDFKSIRKVRIQNKKDAKIANPIIAMSCILKVRFEKEHFYVVNPHYKAVEHKDILKSVEIITYASVLFAMLAFIFLLLLYIGGWKWLYHESLFLI